MKWYGGRKKLERAFLNSLHIVFFEGIINDQIISHPVPLLDVIVLQKNKAKWETVH